MIKKFVVLFTFIGGFIGLIAFVNVTIDPGNMFSNINKKVAKLLITGKSVRVPSGNVNERELKRYLIENMDKEVDCISIGPSTITYVDEEMTGSSDFYNLGVTSGDYWDVMAQFALLKKHGVKVNRVIFTLCDSVFSTKGWVEDNTLDDAMMDYSYAMLEYLNTGNFTTKGLGGKSIPEKIKEHLSYPYFSLSYFQASIKYIKTGKVEEFLQIVEGDCDDMYFLSDGSRSYYKLIREASVEDVVSSCNNKDVNTYITTTKIDTKCKNGLILLIEDIQSQGAKVEFYICPLPPALWDKCDEKRMQYLESIDTFAYEYGKMHDIKVTGSYNPYKLGITNDKYYDYGHIKKEYMLDYFDFTE